MEPKNEENDNIYEKEIARLKEQLATKERESGTHKIEISPIEVKEEIEDEIDLHGKIDKALKVHKEKFEHERSQL